MSDPGEEQGEEVSSTESALVSCSGSPTMIGHWLNGVRYTDPVPVSCSSAVSRIRVWGELRIFGVVKATQDVTCWGQSTCTLPKMSAVAGQNDTWTSQYWYNWSL